MINKIWEYLQEFKQRVKLHPEKRREKLHKTDFYLSKKDENHPLQNYVLLMELFRWEIKLLWEGKTSEFCAFITQNVRIAWFLSEAHDLNR